MKNLNDWSLARKLSLAPAACLLLLAAVGLIALWGFAQLAKTLDNLTQDRLPSYSFSARLESDLRDMNGLINESIALAAVGYGDDDVAKVDKALDKLAGTVAQALSDRMSAPGIEPDEKEELLAIHDSYLKYQSSWREAMKMKASALVASATFLSAAQARYKDLRDRLSAASARKLRQAGEEASRATTAAKEARMTIGIVGLVAVICALLLVVVVTRGLLRRIRELSAAARRLADGDLTVPVVTQGRDEVGQLMSDIEGVRTRLAGSLVVVSGSTEALRAAVSEIAAGNLDLEQRTEVTSSSLQGTSSTLQQLTVAVEANLQVAQVAARYSDAAAHEATQGGKLMSEVTQMMSDVTRASQRIAEVIQIIDQIAAQTNILALNAAVESAHAGEQGRGFAVVAAEVRTLAKRSRDAAQEIAQLIREANAHVESGQQLVQDAGGSIGSLVSRVGEVARLMNSLCAAVIAQSRDVARINTQLLAVDSSTQQNAALVEQSTAATMSLRSQADKLALAVSHFKLAARASSDSLPTPAETTA